MLDLGIYIFQTSCQNQACVFVRDEMKLFGKLFEEGDITIFSLFF